MSAEAHPRGRTDVAAARRSLVVGLVGGIGSGKTTVAALFAEMGARVLDADGICAKLHGSPAVRRAIRTRWGARVFDPRGHLDRGRLADLVFADGAELRALNRIMHPHVLRRVKREVAACRRRRTGLWVIDAPLLLETGLDGLCDVIVFVECVRHGRARRLARDRGWSAAELHRRERWLRPLAQKRRLADFVVVNTGSRAATRRQVRQILATLAEFGEQTWPRKSREGRGTRT